MTTTSCHCLLSFGFVAVKKETTRSCRRLIHFGFIAEKKKRTTTFVTFFNGFVAKNVDGNYRHLF
jgi:hypothetical protein